MNEETMSVTRYRSVEEAISEAERETNVRVRCFPRWVKEGRVNRIDAVDRLDRLATVVILLEAMSENTEVAKLMTSIIESKNSQNTKSPA